MRILAEIRAQKYRIQQIRMRERMHMTRIKCEPMCGVYGLRCMHCSKGQSNEQLGKGSPKLTIEFEQEDNALRVKSVDASNFPLEGLSSILSSLRVHRLGTSGPSVNHHCQLEGTGSPTGRVAAEGLFTAVRLERSDKLRSASMVLESGDYSEIEERVLAWMVEEYWQSGYPCVLWDEASSERVSPFTYARPEPGQVCVLRRRDGSSLHFYLDTREKCDFVRAFLKSAQFYASQRSASRGCFVCNTNWRICPEWFAAWHIFQYPECADVPLSNEWKEWASSCVARPRPGWSGWQRLIKQVLETDRRSAQNGYK